MSTSKPDVQATHVAMVDLRPSRLDIEALLIGSSLSASQRQAVIEAFAQHALLYGGNIFPIEQRTCPVVFLVQKSRRLLRCSMETPGQPCCRSSSR
jgi:hypothetical protein